MDQQLDVSSTQQPRSFGHYLDSNPSSTHSSPRTYPADLEPYYPPTQHAPNMVHSQTYPIPAGVSVHPYIPAQQRRPHPMQNSRSSSYSSYPGPVPLQVSTSTSSAHEHDPNERTARPGNAHRHAQFHSSIAQATSSSTPSASTSNLSQAGSSSASVGPNQTADGGDGDGGGQRQEPYVSSTPGVQMGLSRPLKPIEQERLNHLDRLKFFLATAPSRWDSAATNANPTGITSAGAQGEEFGAHYSSALGGYGAGAGFSGMGLGLEPAYHHAPPHPALNRFLLPNQEFVTCVLWNGLYHITGTDIVRALVFRFEAFGRPVKNMKKFEEGVFSDLRNLKPGVDACLEEPKSPFLDLLFKYQCIRTQKKQKVFYWFSVPHDRLFLDALERDLKREKMGLEPTTQIVGEPALSFTYDPKRSLYEQFSKAQGAREGEGELETAIRIAERSKDAESADGGDSAMDESDASEVDDGMNGDDEGKRRPSTGAGALPGSQYLNLFTLFEGSPTYKQRRKKVNKSSALSKSGDEYGDEYDRGRSMDPSSGRYSSQSRERRHLPLPRHPSMMDEFGPNSESANTSEVMSAADMFLKQARGELVPADGVVRKPKPQPIVGDVGVFYSEGGPSDQQSGHTRGRSFDLVREGPVPRPPGSLSAGYTASTFSEAGQQQVVHPGQMTTGMAQYEAVSEDGKVRAFVCPLYSCGRLFKRMEHLKRHLRTHTMERPFTCNRCNKKFSRSDNLTQHLRTHERTGHGSLPGSTGGNEWIEGAEDADASGNESANEGGSVADSDDDGGLHGMTNFHQIPGGLEMFGEGVMPMDFVMSEGAGFGMNNLDTQMCEVEVPASMQDVAGDEGGLLMRTAGQASGSDSFFSSMGSSAPSSGMLFSSGSEFTDSAQWIDHPQPSAGFNAISAPLRANMRGVQGHQSHSSTSSTSSAFGDEYSAASLSAPSHKQSFDHSVLYPPGMMDSVGPMRRHRSMTPSLIRNGEPIRRPMTSNSNEFPGTSGSPASVSSSIGSSRGYHPYAYSGSNSRANSTHNSPQVQPVPLGPDYAPIRRSDSRSSNYSTSGLNDQMRQMMSMDPSSSMVETMFRSDSPASFHQTESPAGFNMDLPLQYSATGPFIPSQPQPLHASTMPAQYPQQQQQQQQFEGYYTQPHATL